MIHRFAFAALAVIGLTGFAAATARADEAGAEAVWKKYWTAIEVEKTCNNTSFSEAQYDNMVKRIDERMNYVLGAGISHQLMSDAKNDAFDLTFKYGCSSPQAMELLSLYKNDLAPVVGSQ
jgi:hypothetical protein